MRNVLIFFGILVIAISILLILQHIFGWNLVSKKEYMFVVLTFVALYLLHEKGKRPKEKKN